MMLVLPNSKKTTSSLPSSSKNFITPSNNTKNVENRTPPIYITFNQKIVDSESEKVVNFIGIKVEVTIYMKLILKHVQRS